MSHMIHPTLYKGKTSPVELTRGVLYTVEDLMTNFEAPIAIQPPAYLPKNALLYEITSKVNKWTSRMIELEFVAGTSFSDYVFFLQRCKLRLY